MGSDPSIKDELTGVFNYDYFQESLKQEIERSNRHGKSFSIVRLDIDNFKDINENYGFEFGNIILKQVSNLLKGTTRGSDIIARQDAEEFVVILPEVNLNDAIIFSERVRTRVEDSENFGNHESKLRLTVSMGIVTYSRKDAMELTQMLQLLDTAVYQAKQDGRNCIVPYTSFLPPEESYL
jgi:diguanylate cyclase (GGDEF)-like protein